MTVPSRISMDIAPATSSAKPRRTRPPPATSARGLAAAVAEFLDGLGIAHPHVAGNSLGGWIALELARLRPLASVTLLSPAGLWRGSTPRYQRVTLRASRQLSRHGGRPLRWLVGHP